jgi:pimeloyl-ACP methyl ester carboxylesterase
MRQARISIGGRFALLAAVAAIATAAVVNPAAGGPSGKTEAASETRTLTTEDGVSIHITYYKSSTEEKEAPVVVLLHMKDGNRLVWEGQDGLAQKLQKEGYAVVTVDLRQHGESKIGGAVGGGNANQAKKKGKKGSGMDLKPVEYELMYEQDMQAVKQFILQEHQAGRLNMNKMAIVGAEMGASIAAAYTVVDWEKEPFDDSSDVRYRTPRGQDVKALVLISPQEKFHGLQLSRAIQVLKNPDWGIAFFVCSGNDSKDEAQSKKIFDMLTSPSYDKKRMASRTYGAKLPGTDLLYKGLTIEDDIVGFLNSTVKKVDSPWRDRRSRRELKKK